MNLEDQLSSHSHPVVESELSHINNLLAFLSLVKWFIRSYDIHEILGLKSLASIFGATLKQFFHLITLYVCERETKRLHTPKEIIKYLKMSKYSCFIKKKKKKRVLLTKGLK